MIHEGVFKVSNAYIYEIIDKYINMSTKKLKFKDISGDPFYFAP